MAESDCWTALLEYFGRAYTGGNLKTFRRYITHYNLDCSHFIKYRSLKRTAANFKNRKYTDSDLFSVNNIHPTIIKYHYRKFYPPVLCSRCGTGDTWCGQKLTLQIDHINGNNKDHRLENLRYLCPNCHTQTDTFGRKDRDRWSGGIKTKRKPDMSHTRKYSWPDVYKAYMLDPCYSRVAKLFGMSDNGVKKIVTKMSMVRGEGFEPPTKTMSTFHSTPELTSH